MGRIGRRTASSRIVAQARGRISKPSTVRLRRNPVKPTRQTRGIRRKSLVSRLVSKPSQPKIRRIRTETIRKLPKRVSTSGIRDVKNRRSFTKVRSGPIGAGPIPPKRVVARAPQFATVTKFGSGGSAITNVFGLIQQTSIQNAAKREQFKKEGRTGSIFFDSFFDQEFL